MRSFRAPSLPPDEAVVVAPHGLPRLESHVIVAGYGQAARRLVRVLAGSRIPFVITTLSPEGALEAEAEGLPVLRGDATRPHTLGLAGVERAKVFVVPDDDPAMARRIVAVARVLNPLMRIVVRTRYIAEIQPLLAAGADEVIAEELESVVALFADVMRSYEVDAREIAAHEDAMRRGGYAALREPGAKPVVECHLGPDCLERRTVTIRAGAPVVGRRAGELPVTVERVRRDGTIREPPADDEVLRAGDEVVVAAPVSALTRSAPLFRPGPLEPALLAEALRPEQITVDTERVVELRLDGAARCAHVTQIRPVLPSARGCEECLAIGARWVHLRICMSCGHVGCCDSSEHKHASAHYRSTEHPIMRSLQPGEEWGWCFVDELTLGGA
jgi:CPA2 family monovalent cation:H+ antiporter-2